MSIAVDVEQMENTVLYACWGPNRYTVTIDKSGGTGGCDYFYAFYECRMTGFSSPKLDGYYYDHVGANGFAGWITFSIDYTYWSTAYRRVTCADGLSGNLTMNTPIHNQIAYN